MIQKRTFAAAGLLLLAVSCFAGCGKNNKKNIYDSLSALESSIVAQYGFNEYTSLTDASSAVGFSLRLPDFSSGMELKTIRASQEHALMEVVYTDGGNPIRIRKGRGEEDISGNTAAYPETFQDYSEDMPVVLKGAKNRLNLALWNKNGYAYSIESIEPLEGAIMLDLVRIVADDGQTPPGDSPAQGQGERASYNPFENTLGGDFLQNRVEIASVEEAIALTGFDLDTPEEIEGFSEKTLYADGNPDNPVLETLFSSPGGSRLCIRKGYGHGDLSGDTREFDSSETVIVGERQVMIRQKSGRIYTATWIEGDFSLSVCSDEGLEGDRMLSLIPVIQ